MAWIESNKELAIHPKTKRAAKLLGVSIPTMLGHLHLLWYWCMDYAQDGDLTDFEADEIADACMWEGEPDDLINALVNCGPGKRKGFLEKDDDALLVHDWMDYAGKFMEQVQQQKERSKRKRELYGDEQLTHSVRKRDGDYCRYCGKKVNWKDRKSADGGTYDQVDPEGPNSKENVVVACRGCVSEKQKRTPEQANMPLLPPGRLSVSDLPEIYPTSNLASALPNLTKPNLTKQNLDITTTTTRAREEKTDLGIQAVWFAETQWGRLLSPLDTETIIGWCETFSAKGSAEADLVVIEGLKECNDANARNMNYLKSVMVNWLEAGILTVAQVEVKRAERKKRKSNNKDPDQKTSPEKYENFYL